MPPLNLINILWPTEAPILKLTITNGTISSTYNIHPNGDNAKCVGIVGGKYTNGTNVDMYVSYLLRPSGFIASLDTTATSLTLRSGNGLATHSSLSTQPISHNGASTPGFPINVH